MQGLNVVFNNIDRYIFNIRLGEHKYFQARNIFGIKVKNWIDLKALMLLPKIINKINAKTYGFPKKQ